MLLVDAVDPGATDSLGRDHPDALEVPKRLLNCTEAVPFNECVNTPPGERCASAEQRGKDRATRSRYQPTERLSKVHVTRIVFM